MASFLSYGCRIWTRRRRRRKRRLLPIIAQYIYDGEDLGHPYIQSTTVLCDNTHVHTNTHSTHIFRWLATTNSIYLCRIVHIAHGEGWGTLLCKASARLISSRAKAAFKDTHVQLEGHILLADGVLILKHPQHPLLGTCENKQIMLEKHTKPIIRCKNTASHFLSLSNEMFHMSKWKLLIMQWVHTTTPVWL